MVSRTHESAFILLRVPLRALVSADALRSARDAPICAGYARDLLGVKIHVQTASAYARGFVCGQRRICWAFDALSVYLSDVVCTANARSVNYFLLTVYARARIVVVWVLD